MLPCSNEEGWGFTPALLGTITDLGPYLQQHIPQLPGERLPTGRLCARAEAVTFVLPSLREEAAKNWVSACEILEEQPQILAIFSFTEAVHTLARACLPPCL